MNSLYFIAINTPDEVSQEVRSVQQEFADQYGAKRQLRTPVHVTLIPPFRADDDLLSDIHASLKEFCLSQSGFTISLNGFGAFGNRTIFIDVIRTDELQNLFDQLHSWLERDINFVPPIKHPRFNPHVTVANRDLSPEQFDKAWPIYEQRSFISSFYADKVTLLRHDGKHWEVFKELSFAQ